MRRENLLASFSRAWGLGLALGLCIALACLAGAAVAAVLLGIPSLLLGWSAATYEWTLNLSAFVWLPLSVGLVWPSLVEAFGRHAAKERGAELASFGDKAR